MAGAQGTVGESYTMGVIDRLVDSAGVKAFYLLLSNEQS